MAMCSDIVINPVPKPSAKTAKKVKVRCRNNPYSDEFDFMIHFWEICAEHGARPYIAGCKNYIICCSEENNLIYSFRAFADFGAFIPYFPDEESANAVINEFSKNNMIKYFFRKENDEECSLPF